MTIHIGRLEEVSNDFASGWAAGSADSSPAIVNIFIDEIFCGQSVADMFREDLETVGIRDGYASFRYQIPSKFIDGQPHLINAVDKALGRPLHNSPIMFQSSPFNSEPFVERAQWAQSSLAIHSSTAAPTCVEAVRHTRKLAVVSTYHKLNTFLAYHSHLAHALRDIGFTVLIAHATDTFDSELSGIESDGIFLYGKRNVGYDFGSWIFGYLMMAEALGEIEEIIFINDSIIGPITNLHAIYNAIKQTKADMVGLTDSYERVYHLQSYFMWFGPAICKSSALPQFCVEYPFISDKETVIARGELHITKMMQDMGFKTAALFPYERVADQWLRDTATLERAIGSLFRSGNGREGLMPSATLSPRLKLLDSLDTITGFVTGGTPLNPTHFFWDTLIEKFDYPFIKREFVIHNPALVPSYFRLSHIVEKCPAFMAEHILEIRQRYGGTVVPFFTAKPAPHASQAEPRLRVNGSNIHINSARALTADRKGRSRTISGSPQRVEAEALDEMH